MFVLAKQQSKLPAKTLLVIPPLSNQLPKLLLVFVPGIALSRFGKDTPRLPWYEGICYLIAPARLVNNRERERERALGVAGKRNLESHL